MSRLEHFVVGSGPVPAVAQGIARYRALSGQGPEGRSFHDVAVDPVVVHHVSNLYQAAPDFDHAALPHFHAMREEIGRQYDFMTAPRHKGGMGISVDIADSDPYTTSTGAQRPADPRARRRGCGPPRGGGARPAAGVACKVAHRARGDR